MKALPENFVYELQQRTNRSFKVLYARYADQLQCVIDSKLGGPDHFASEDLLQETFLEIWRKIHLYDGNKGQLIGWMKRLATTTALDYYGAGQTHRRNTIRLTAGTWAPEYTYELNFTRLDMVRAFECLTEREQQYAAYKFIYGYTQSEIAVMFNLASGTIKGRHATVLRKLRAHLRVHGNKDFMNHYPVY